PFFHFWLVLWIVLTPMITFAIYRFEKRNGGYE
ncbi:membrane protein, partial [Bacillus amyloliquefaciens]